MKKLFLFTLIIGSSIMAFGQSKMACCKQSATQQFAMLASDKKFVMSHPKPLPFISRAALAKPLPTQRQMDELPMLTSLKPKHQPTITFWWCMNILG